MGQHVEGLQAGWVAEVGRVGVGGQGEVGVGRVGRGQVRDEVVEAAVVGVADGADLFEQLLRGRRVDGRARDKGEAVLALGSAGLWSVGIQEEG